MTKQTTIVVIGSLRVKFILLHVDVIKTSGWVTNRVDPDQRRVLRRLIWVYTVYSDLSVRLFRDDMMHVLE